MLSTTEQEFLMVLAEGDLNKDTYLHSKGVIHMFNLRHQRKPVYLIKHHRDLENRARRKCPPRQGE